jgi:hypothetical protein
MIKKLANDLVNELKSAHWLWWVGLICVICLI